jgi:hypothetical protein
MAPGIAGAGACAGRWPTPCASGRSQHGWRSAGCRAPTPPSSAGACKTVPSGHRRATGASARGGAAGGWTRAPYCGRTVLRPGRVIPSWAGAAQHFLSKICDRTIKRVGPPGYPGATASERATGKAGGESSQTGWHTLRGVRHPSAARTALLRGLRRPNRTFLGENGQVQWEVGRRPA